jgi:hypothetical protein
MLSIAHGVLVFQGNPWSAGRPAFNDFGDRGVDRAHKKEIPRVHYGGLESRAGQGGQGNYHN